MSYLREQFKEALSNIEPGEDKTNAPDAHRAVRNALEADATLSDYGVDPVLIGSYKRSVSIRRVKDVDVFVRMPEIPTDVTAQQILDKFFAVLNVAFGRDSDGRLRTKRQDRSLQVSFPEYDLYVDAVPARRTFDGNAWEIPQRGGSDQWVRTNPVELTRLSSEMNADFDEFYVPTVKLIRQTRRTILRAGARPGGFFFEMAAYKAFSSGAVTGTTHAEYYANALRAISAILDDCVLRGIPVEDPSLPGASIAVRADDAEWMHARQQFADAAERAADALAIDDEGKAATSFQQLLGKNGDGALVFPMPPGYDEDGKRRVAGLVPGERHVPAGSRTFG